MEITAVASTYCFVQPDGGALAQVVRVTLAGAPAESEVEVAIEGEGFELVAPFRGRPAPGDAGLPGGPAWAPAADDGLRTSPPRFTLAPPLPGGVVVELPVVVGAGSPAGRVLAGRATARAAGGERAEAEAHLVVRRPGWRMLMVSHFHYDPVWWNTQAGYTSGWDELVWALDTRESFQHSGLALVEAHLERARVDPAYKFVLAEVDYLKPFWDLYPDRREELRDLLAAGRVEIVGGTYNEPNTNLTGAETAIRCAVYGMGFQRDLLGGDPRSAWQLDVFGHDPQFPGIMADCGIDSSAWARGPFHQWGPTRETGSNAWMQFPSEFEWIAPNGKGLLTSYMPNHYSAGWELERATTLPGAMWRAYELFESLAEVAATRVVLLPVGTDYTPPSRYVTDLAEEWSRRYVWPRFEVGLPREFFAAVRAELEEAGRRPSPQTRDMNPIYTGKDVSFVDTKQAQRLAERTLADAETTAALALLLGTPSPHRALDKAWRQLVFGAHHDGITGSESDQVYLDLLGGWREAYELARLVADGSRRRLLDEVDTTGEGEALVVTNTLGTPRSDVVELELPPEADGRSLEVLDGAGERLAALAEPSPSAQGSRLLLLAESVPGVGYRTYRLRRSRRSLEGWRPAEGWTIANEHLEVSADPGRGGGLSSICDRSAGFELVAPGEVANELLVYPEYPSHPRFGEGPWHLLPAGPPARSGGRPATVRREVSPLGERLVVSGALEELAYRQVVTLWRGLRRLEVRTEVHDWVASDRLLRLRVPTALAGGTPVSAVGDAVVARGFALIDVDSAEEPWTLDNPAADWFGLSTTLLVEATEAGTPYHRRSVGVAEVVVPPGEGGAAPVRELLVALVQQGVTATCSEADRNRYGALLGDSNLPDFRIAVGGPSENAFVAGLLAGAGEHRAELERQLAAAGRARVLVPAERSLREVWVPGADLRGTRQLPVLVVAGEDAAATAACLSELSAAVRSGRVGVEQPAALVPAPERTPEWTVALLNRGIPGFAVDAGGALHLSLLRACTGWPSGVWIDPPRRRAPDGSAFELEHWSHVFEHAVLLARGDWRSAGCVAEAQAYNRPLVASLAAGHGGALPADAALLAVSAAPAAEAGEGGGEVVLAALKPAGHPLASGDAATAAGSGHPRLVARCYEAHGRPAAVVIGSRLELVGAHGADLLEQPGEALQLAVGGDGGRSARLELGAAELSTVLLDFAAPAAEGAADAAAGDRHAEVAQPVFSRYWLHNKGPAPVGNQAVAVHVLPTAVVVRAGDTFGLGAQVASGSAHDVQTGTLLVGAPEGWEVDPPSRIYSLAPGRYLRLAVTGRVPEGCHPGRYFVAVSAADGAGQLQEDVATVDVLPAFSPALGNGAVVAGGLLSTPAPVGHPASQAAAELEAVLEPDEVAVPAGGLGHLVLRLTNRTRAALRGEAQLVSPIETWPLLGPWTQGFAIAPGGMARLEAEVRGPAAGWLRSWALFKVAYFGRLWYSPAVELRLGGDSAKMAATGGRA